MCLIFSGTPETDTNTRIELPFGREGDDVSPQRLPGIWAIHPHGLLNVAPIFGFGAYGPAPDPVIKDIVLGATSVLFAIPAVRDVSLWLGAIDVNRDTLRHQLTEGRSVLLLPGGLQEFILNSRSCLNIYTKHTGFASHRERAAEKAGGMEGGQSVGQDWVGLHDVVFGRCYLFLHGLLAPW